MPDALYITMPKSSDMQTLCFLLFFKCRVHPDGVDGMTHLKPRAGKRVIPSLVSILVALHHVWDYTPSVKRRRKSNVALRLI